MNSLSLCRVKESTTSHSVLRKLPIFPFKKESMSYVDFSKSTHRAIDFRGSTPPRGVKKRRGEVRNGRG